MPKLRELVQKPPEPEGSPEEQLEALRDYLRKVTQELEYLLTHLEADNINDTTFERISEMIPRPYTGLPLMDGEASAGTSANWSRGNHRHPHDDTKADVTALENHKADTDNPHSVTKAQVGLGNVANERQYSAQNPPPIPTPGEVGAVPVTREINGHALSADVTLDHTDVGAIPSTDKGSAGGVAELDANGMVPSAQLPSYVDDVMEYASLTDFPAAGESGKIYVAQDTNRTYRWSGSAYVEISESLALGETSSTAYRGDRGKTAYDHSQTTGNPHGTTAAEVGLGNVANERQYSAQNPPPLPTPSDIGAQEEILVNGILKGDGTGGISAAQAGTDYGTYSKPSGGIPASDMTSAVQTSLGKADTAYQKPSGGIPASDLANGVIPTVPSPSDSAPQDLASTAAAGSSGNYSRADHAHKLPSASDVGALAVDGTAAAASRLNWSHKSSEVQGWHRILTIPFSGGGLRRKFVILVEASGSGMVGILRCNWMRGSASSFTSAASWLAVGSAGWADAATNVDGSNISLYINKTATTGHLVITILSSTNQNGNDINLQQYFAGTTSDADYVSALPAGAVIASGPVAELDGAGNNIADGKLWYSSVPVSSGANQVVSTISDSRITADYVLARIEFADPSLIMAGYSWSTGAGNFTLTGSVFSATTANVLLIRKGI